MPTLAAVHVVRERPTNPSEAAEFERSKNFYDDLARIVARRIVCPEHHSGSIQHISSARWYIAQALIAAQEYSKKNQVWQALPLNDKGEDDFGEAVAWHIQQTLGYVKDKSDPEDADAVNIARLGNSVSNIWQKLLSEDREYGPSELMKQLAKEKNPALTSLNQGIEYTWTKYTGRINQSKQCERYKETIAEERFNAPKFQQDGHATRIDEDTTKSEERGHKLAKYLPWNWGKGKKTEPLTRETLAEATDPRHGEESTVEFGAPRAKEGKKRGFHRRDEGIPKSWENFSNDELAWGLMPSAKFVATPRGQTGSPISKNQHLLIAMHRTACGSPKKTSSHPSTDAHFTVHKDGTIYQHAPVSRQRTSATAGNNPWTINIEFESCYSGKLDQNRFGGVHRYEDMTKEQMDAGASVMAFISQAYGSQGKDIPLTWAPTDYKSAQAKSSAWRGQMFTNGGSPSRPVRSGVSDHAHLGKPGEGGIHHDDGWFEGTQGYFDMQYMLKSSAQLKKSSNFMYLN